MEHRIRLMLVDKDPIVRLPIALQLDKLSDISSSAMWDMAEIFSRNEMNVGVLSFLIGGPINHMLCIGRERGRGVKILDEIFQRKLDDNNYNQKSRFWSDFSSNCGQIAAELWVNLEHEIALKWIRHWLTDVAGNQSYLGSILSCIQSSLLDCYLPDQTSCLEHRRRAHGLLDLIIDAASEDRKSALSKYNDPNISEDEKTDIAGLYRAGSFLLERACQPFHSRFSPNRINQNQNVACSEILEKQVLKKVLGDYEITLRKLGETGDASTLYQLTEIYEGLAVGNPELVFELVVDCLIGRGTKERYHQEQLGLDSVIRLVHLYLVNYRSMFEEGEYYERLMGVLALFANAGWPKALKLLYELPDIVR